jgi:deoxyribodipyrimidine photolyase-related protein
MRAYADALSEKGRQIIYFRYKPDNCFIDVLRKHLRQSEAKGLIWMAGASRGLDEALHALCEAEGLQARKLENQQFLTSRDVFAGWYTRQKQPRMENFYRWQRKRLGILMEDDAPAGGEWNFDRENRKTLPRTGITVPALPAPSACRHESDAWQVIRANFGHHPGEARGLWMPVTRAGALAWLDDFIAMRLAFFGPYEDAMRADAPFLFHSVLSPLLNIGLLSPEEVLSKVLDAYSAGQAALVSVEGFIRQVIGWREYMVGVYWQEAGLEKENYFGFQKPLEAWWYSEDYQKQALPMPVKTVLGRVHAMGYAHHIERLMVLGNWFLLNEYDPRSVTDWFTAMFVDAYAWVMIPNVMGMSQYADGGRLASKPYISGGNYLQKMGRWWENDTAARDSVFTELYWTFLKEHRDSLKDNARMALALKMADKIKE